MIRRMLRRSPSSWTSDIGFGINGANQALDGAIGEIDIGGDEDEEAYHQPDGEKAQHAEAEPHPERLDGVFEMAFPDRAFDFVAFDVRKDDACNAGKSHAEQR